MTTRKNLLPPTMARSCVLLCDHGGLTSIPYGFDSDSSSSIDTRCRSEIGVDAEKSHAFFEVKKEDDVTVREHTE